MTRGRYFTPVFSNHVRKHTWVLATKSKADTVHPEVCFSNVCCFCSCHVYHLILCANLKIFGNISVQDVMTAVLKLRCHVDKYSEYVARQFPEMLDLG